LRQLWYKENPSAYETLKKTLIERFPTLHAIIDEGAVTILGRYYLKENEFEIDQYQIEIRLPDAYPNALPSVWETDDRIPRLADRHVMPNTGELCLGVPEEIWILLNGNFSIETFLDGPVRNYFIGNTLVEKGEPWPFGERKHGDPGIIQFYEDQIGTNTLAGIIHIIGLVLTKKIRGHWPCPCKSGEIIRRCHTSIIQDLPRIPVNILFRAFEKFSKRLKRESQKNSGPTG
jgi:hypothetical protein